MGLLDAIFGGGGDDYAKQAANLYDKLEAPSIDEQMLLLQQYVDAGEITPEQARAYLVNSNAADDMEFDTQGKQAQLAALQQLTELGNEGGLSASDKANLSRISTEENAQARGAREAILQNAQARGAGGSGLEMLNQLTNAQESATRKSQRDLDVAAMAQERALQAMQAAGQLGGNINQQQFSQQKSLADTKNEIAKFNAANQQNVGLTNTAANNAAQMANLQNKQKTANANVDLQNQQQQYNKGLAQQNFQNQQAVVSGKANALTGQANRADADRKEDMDVVGGIGKAALGFFSDERVKEDISKFDAGSFLDDLTGYKYKYKDPAMGAGEQVGVMAQAIEKEVPQMVEDTPRGKVVDASPAKTTGPILASLADLNERLRRIEGK